ncbi:cupin-like domain-containing protein [Luteimonas deserti]|uniref:Cupin-like domain-containing protein n=1 Tax=Luteimonas deserti TaxID=2752306 RepID=A0A7Z0QNM8_9GAMM|nr:cupin-like domain-containing protein [Luteimonas deserti]NYZ61171.1 cupin-like domain-containing protein [Luteimonas deserti]
MQVDKRIAECGGLRPDTIPDAVLRSTTPLVLRGLLADWPVVHAARQSGPAAAAYLQRFERRGGPPVVATVGPPGIDGRFFYNDDFSGFNFRRENVPLGVALNTLVKYITDPAPPAIYIGSTTIDTWLPGFRAENDVDLGGRDALASIWIGNRTRIAAHQDLPDNLACVVAGRRRATLFPPQQLENLYIGPLDPTPAGQAVSLVDFAEVDHAKFPRFAQAEAHAQVAELEPGDALLIPSMWWHHMEALTPFNVLVNYWWRQAPAWANTPMDTLMSAILSIRDLPAGEREIWRDVFRHYIFDYDEQAVAGHIPTAARGALAPLDATHAQALRTRLLKRLNR